MTESEYSVTDDIDISVVIPAYNCESFLLDAICSALGQHLDTLEIIVYDDGSTDRTVDVAISIADQRLRVFGSNINRGVARARNEGFKRSRGRFVMFLDSDDVLRPDALRRLRAAFDANPHACVAYGTSRLMDEVGRDIGHDSDAKSYFVKRKTGDVLAQVLSTNFIINGGVMLVRRACVEMTSLYDERLPWSEDWHFTCQLAAAGQFVFVGDAPVLDYRVRPGSLMDSGRADIANYRIALDATFGHPLITARIPGARLARLQRRRWSDVMRRLGTLQLRKRHWFLAIRYFILAVIS